MIFNENKVYTAVNADELCKGDLVIVADNLALLKTQVEETYDPMQIAVIISEENEYRFRVGYEKTYENYALAYFVCPAKNAEAYKAWQQGKAVEMQLSSDDCWTSVVPDFPKTMNDFWFRNNVRVKQTTPQSRPYKDVEELITSYKHSHCYKDNDDIMPLIWVKNGAAKKKKLITAFFEGENLVSVDGEIYDLEYLYKDYTFLDGSPCGVVVKE